MLFGIRIKSVSLVFFSSALSLALNFNGYASPPSRVSCRCSSEVHYSSFYGSYPTCWRLGPAQPRCPRHSKWETYARVPQPEEEKPAAPDTGEELPTPKPEMKGPAPKPEEKLPNNNPDR
jgi:hypothetical protein